MNDLAVLRKGEKLDAGHLGFEGLNYGPLEYRIRLV